MHTSRSSCRSMKRCAHFVPEYAYELDAAMWAVVDHAHLTLHTRYHSCVQCAYAGVDAQACKNVQVQKQAWSVRAYSKWQTRHTPCELSCCGQAMYMHPHALHAVVHVIDRQRMCIRVCICHASTPQCRPAMPMGTHVHMPVWEIETRHLHWHVHMPSQ